MANSRVTAPLRGNSRAVRKHNGANNRQQHHAMHHDSGRARQGRPGQLRSKHKGTRKGSGDGNGASPSTGTPVEPSHSRQWCIAWPSQASSEPPRSSEPEGRNEQHLTQWMRNTKNLDNLLNIIIKYGDSFNHVHTTAALGFLHAKLQNSRSAATQPTHSVKMLEDLKSEQHRSPLLGGEPICMYIGDLCEAPLPQHGPLTVDSHASPFPETSLSLQELYTYDTASREMQEAVAFPPRGTFPEAGMKLPEDSVALPLQPKSPKPDFDMFSRPELPPALVTAPVPPRSSRDGNGAHGNVARGNDDLMQGVHRTTPADYVTSSVSTRGNSEGSSSLNSIYIDVSSISSPDERAHMSDSAENETDRSVSGEKQKVLECLQKAIHFADDIASTLAVGDCSPSSQHPAVLPKSMHTMQFLGPNRGIGHSAEQSCLANGLVRDATGAVVYEPHASISGYGSTSATPAAPIDTLQNRPEGSEKSEQRPNSAAVQSSQSGNVATGASAPNAHMHVRTNSGTSTPSVPSTSAGASPAGGNSSALHGVHALRRGGLYYRRRQLFQELEVGEERRGVQVADGWQLPGFTEVPNVQKEMWPKLLYALDIVCRKLYSEIENMTPREVSNVLCTLKKLEYYDSHLTYLLLKRSLCFCQGPSGRRLRLARNSLVDRHGAPAATLTEEQEPRMTGQSASMIAWAVCMHGLHMRGSTYAIARQVIIALRDMIPSIVHDMDAQSIGNISLALVTTSHAKTYTMVALAMRARQVLDTFTFQELGMWLTAMSPFLNSTPKLREVLQDVEKVVAKQILEIDFSKQSRQGSAIQGVSSLMWVATSSSGMGEQVWFPSTDNKKTYQDNLTSSNAVNGSGNRNVASEGDGRTSGRIITRHSINFDSEAEVPHGGGVILHAVMKRVPDLTACIGPEHAKSTARMLWCMASHLYFHEHLVGALVRSVLGGIRSSGEIRRWEPSTWLWAIARLNVPLSKQERATILSYCKQFYPSGSSVSCSLKATTHVIWGLSLIGIMDLSLRRKLALELRAAADQAQKHQIADERYHTMLVFAEVNNFLRRKSSSSEKGHNSSINSPEYSAAYTPAGASRYSRFAADRERSRSPGPREVSTGAVNSKKSNDSSEIKVLGAGLKDSPKREAECTLWSEGNSGVGAISSGELLHWLRNDSILPARIREQAIRGTMENVRLAAQKPPSRFQLQVFNMLQAMGTKPVSEYITADGLFAIDIALWARGATRIAVEVDGPSHFAVNDLEHVTGQTLARRHALERLGWVVVSVPLPLWVQLRGHAEKEEWLREQLLLATRSGTAAVSAAQRAGHGRPQSAQQAQRRVCHAEQQGARQPRGGANHSTPPLNGAHRPWAPGGGVERMKQGEQAAAADDGSNLTEWMPNDSKNKKVKGQWLGGPPGSGEKPLKRSPRKRVKAPKDVEALLANGSGKIGGPKRPAKRPKRPIIGAQPPPSVKQAGR